MVELTDPVFAGVGESARAEMMDDSRYEDKLKPTPLLSSTTGRDTATQQLLVPSVHV